MKKEKFARVLNRVSAINILICTVFLIWCNRLEHLVWHDPSSDSQDLWHLCWYLLDFAVPFLAVSEIFFIKTKRKMLGTATKKEIIVNVIEWIYVLAILIMSFYLIYVYWLGHDRSETFYRSTDLLYAVAPVLVISEIFLAVTKMKKLGTATKKEKIVTFIKQLAELNILMNTLYLLWWTAERREPGLAEKMGFGCVHDTFIFEILVICLAVYLNKMHKSDGAASEKKHHGKRKKFAVKIWGERI